MKLPNYFLADLPPEATLSPLMISEACQTLKRNRERYLASRSTQSLIHILSKLAQGWLDREFPFRQKALQAGPKESGFSEPVLHDGLDAFFSRITEENLEALLIQEFGHLDRLDAFSASDLEKNVKRSSSVRGPELLVHITGGVLPNPTLMSILLGLLLRSAQLVKCASGTSFLPRLFAHSLYDAEPKLGACLEIAEWRGGNLALENALFAEANAVTATGSDETLEKIRAQLPRQVRFVGYGHRVSFGYIAREVLSSAEISKIVKCASDDVIAWNQLGCLSPHVFYVESGGTISPERFAELMAEALENREKSYPRGSLKTDEAVAIASRRSFYEVRAAGVEGTRLWQSMNSTCWTVIYEADPRFQPSCLNRFIYVKAVANLEEALQGADSVYGRVSTIGLAATSNRANELATQLARWGATRICPLGQMQNPPLMWRHDGRPVLGDLVTWTDWEF